MWKVIKHKTERFESIEVGRVFFGILNEYIDGLVPDCSNSSALAMELLQSCTKPSIYDPIIGSNNGVFLLSAEITFENVDRSV